LLLFYYTAKINRILKPPKYFFRAIKKGPKPP